VKNKIAIVKNLERERESISNSLDNSDHVLFYILSMDQMGKTVPGCNYIETACPQKILHRSFYILRSTLGEKILTSPNQGKKALK
jgi:hypothetical protein